MKKTILSVLIIIALAVTFVSCFTPESEGEPSLWDSAIYKEDTALGEGAITFTVSIEAAGKKVKLTVSTDKTILGEALYELNLVNDASFFNVANGMLASWDKDQAYWGFYIGDNMASHGISDEPLANGNSYRLVYTK